MKAQKVFSTVAAAVALALTLTSCGETAEQVNMQTTEEKGNNVESVNETEEQGNTQITAENDIYSIDFVKEALEKCVEYPEDYKYTIYTADDGEECAEITEYFGNKTEIKIPNTYKGFPVRRIGRCAFTNNRKGFDVTCVVIQDNMKEIDDDAFYESNTSNYGSPKLQTIVIPGNVKRIGRSAFSGCPRLKNVAIGEGVEYIDSYAFSRCTSLKSLYLPNSLTYIDPSVVFSSAGYNQTSATFTYKGNEYDSAVSSEMRRLADDVICGDSPLMIEDGIVTYCRYDVTEVTIPDDVKEIGSEAFSKRKNLSKVTIPDGVTSKISGFFGGCEYLKVTYKGKTYNLDDSTEETEFYDEIICGDSSIRIEDDVVIYCRHDATEVIIPDGVKEIDDKAFYKRENLVSLKIPDGVTEIAESSFSGCSSLVDLSIPDSVTKIGSGENPKDYFIVSDSLYNVIKGCKNLKATYKGKTYSYSERRQLFVDINGQ